MTDPTPATPTDARAEALRRLPMNESAVRDQMRDQFVAGAQWQSDRTAAHTGQHLQGCVSCYAVTAARAEANYFARRLNARLDEESERTAAREPDDTERDALAFQLCSVQNPADPVQAWRGTAGEFKADADALIAAGWHR